MRMKGTGMLETGRWRVCAGLLMVSCLWGRVSGENWPRFRGPGGAGLSEAKTIPVEISERDYRWRVKLPGKGHSSPVVWGDRLFLTCADDQGHRSVVGLNTRDGRILWTRVASVTPYSQHQFNSFASSTPALDDERVYIAWTTGQSLIVWALDHEGHDIWRRELGAYHAQHGSGASPVVMGDVLVIGNDQEGEGSFIAGLNKRTGETIWRNERKSSRASYITPAVYTPLNGKPQLIFSSTSHGLTSLDPENGKVNWEVNPGLTQRCVGSPVVAGDIIFASAGSGGGGKESLAVRVDPDRPGTQPAIAWELRKGLPYVPTPIAYGGLMFLWNDGGVVTCLRPQSGQVVWKERVGGRFFGSPVCVNGKLYAISMEGQLVVIAAGEKFEVLGRHDLGEGSQATPAVAQGVMYLRTAGWLMAVGGG